ncbi:MAG: hypothetical protein K0M46_07240 [Thiobacillus sp.]|nr:hypothetical protein [Thiobacillus sp.]
MIIASQILASLFCMLLAVTASAESISSRYGTVATTEVPNSEGAFAVSFENKILATIEAEDVSLIRVTPYGKDEHIIIQKGMPGLHCHYEFQLLTIKQDKKTKLSPSFGECMELKAATYLAQGVQIKLVSPYIEGKKPRIDTYTWANEKLTKQH